MTSSSTDPTSENAPMPRWVKVFGAVLIALVATFVFLHLTGHGMHGHGGAEHGDHGVRGYTDPQP